MRLLSVLAVSLGLVACVAATRPGGTTEAGFTERATYLGAYGWPVKPFTRAHPVRGNFCDPRFTKTTATFHFGIDISAADGTPVYPVASGVAFLRADHPDVVGVTGAGSSTFEYWHITPAVRNGERVVANHTILGRINRGRGHVHFTEITSHVWTNPLRAGALTPYDDPTAPVVTAIRFERAGHAISPARVTGTVDIVADAHDIPSLSAPEPWAKLPTTPPVVRWRLLRGDEPLTRWETIVDCRRSLPPASAFADVYTPRTRKNGPGRPGFYDYYLARGWHSELLPRGAYRIEVAALDVRGNRGVRVLDFRVGTRDLPEVRPAAP